MKKIIAYIDMQKALWQWILLMALAIMWGTSFILMKKGLESFTNLQVAGFRIFISFVFLIPFIFKYLRFLKREILLPLLIVGFIGNAIPAFLFTKAQTHISSSLAGMLNSLTPFMAVIIGGLFYKTSTSKQKIIGVGFGLLGAIGLMYKQGNIIGNLSDIWYSLLIVLATLFYGININVIRNHLKDLNGLQITALSFAMVGPPAGLFLLFSDYSATLQSPDYIQNFLYIVLLALGSSVLAGIGFNVLIHFTSTLFASSVTYLIPIIAIMWGIADGENLSWLQFLSMAIILTSVYMVNKRN